eukprot:14776904-Alexandrium_andersonii.AAC.1
MQWASTDGWGALTPTKATRWNGRRTIDWGTFRALDTWSSAWVDQTRKISDHTLVVFRFFACEGPRKVVWGCRRWGGSGQPEFVWAK